MMLPVEADIQATFKARCPLHCRRAAWSPHRTVAPTSNAARAASWFQPRLDVRPANHQRGHKAHEGRFPAICCKRELDIVRRWEPTFSRLS